jgi:hypothetical protein
MLCRFLLVLALVMALPAFARAQTGPQSDDDRVFRSLAPEQLEEFLASQRIEFKKSAAPKSPGTSYYDFKRGTFNLRLTDYNGKDLMLDNQFNRDLPLAKVNEWNQKAKFSRVSRHQDKAGVFLMLEYNLDLTGGVTRDTLRRFLAQFDQECSGFERFLSSAAVAPPTVEKVYLPVTDAVLEQVLLGLKIEFKKSPTADGDTAYDFHVDGIALRLYNYRGKDLMIDAVFRKIGLDAINKYNVDRKFVRAVNYSTGNERSALEANLDCAAGVTEEMIRYFITIFVPEAQQFAKYVGERTK